MFFILAISIHIIKVQFFNVIANQHVCFTKSKIKSGLFVRLLDVKFNSSKFENG